SARLQAGFYREAAEGLRRAFSVENGNVKTRLGGRITAENRDISELVAAERKASTFSPVSADDKESAARLRSLLALVQATESGAGEQEAAAAADEFVAGDDKMKLHRQLFAANRLLDRDVNLPKVVELTRDAIATGTDAALDVPSAGSAVMASELYEARSLAFSRGEVIAVPEVPRATLSAILRGRIEELAGWALLQEGKPAEAVTRLRRAVSVLPEDSAWWRSSTWRLGAALAAEGKDKEALDNYIRSYRGSKPDVIKYAVVEGLYRKVHGGTKGLEDQIGRNPLQEAAGIPAEPAEPVAQEAPAVEPAPKTVSAPESPPSTAPRIPSRVPIKEFIEPAPEPSPDVPVQEPAAKPSPEIVQEPVSEPSPEASPEVVQESVSAPSPDPSPEPSVESPAIEKTLPESAEPAEKRPQADEQPAPAEPEPSPAAEETAIPAAVPVDDAPTDPEPSPEEKPEITEIDSDQTTPEPDPQPQPQTVPDEEPKPETEKPAELPNPESAELNAPETPADANSPPVEEAAEPAESKPEPEIPPQPASTEPEPETSPMPAIDEPKPQETGEPLLPVKDNELPRTDEPPGNDEKTDPEPSEPATPPAEISEGPISTGAVPRSPSPNASTSLFEPIIISIPRRTPPSLPAADPEKPAAEPAPKSDTDAAAAREKVRLASGDIRPRVVITSRIPGEPERNWCDIRLSEESMSLINNGGTLGVVVEVAGDGDISDLSAFSSSQKDVRAVLDADLPATAKKAHYIIRSTSERTGIYQVVFEASCGRKSLLVQVR
ncbi:MAG: hypothetical protein LOY00_13470, partial [Methylocaldum sp.]|nr:hypothetical protein [Methylocaldum sp.]